MDQPPLRHVWSSLWTKRFADGEVRLRFGLGGDRWDSDQYPLPRFLQAFHRAVAIADAPFAKGCHAVVASIDDATDPAVSRGPRYEDGFAALHASGFSAACTGEWQDVVFPDGTDDAYRWTLRGERLGDDKVTRDCLLWHGIAAEMPVSPSAPIVAFLLDPDVGTMLHVYDDRGMDVMARDSADLHTRHADWLLDDDRDRSVAFLT